MNKNTSLLLARIFFGGLMAWNHGLTKFLELWPFNDIAIRDRDLFGLGAIVSVLLFVLGEFIAPIFVLIGYKTRVFAIFSMITMFFAIVLAHLDDPFRSWEKALLFFIGFLIIFLMGPGKHSIDRN
tara:strand:- start:104 stop:481 length:378 start_codon:yes stop_codon:yes gene_type:complete